MMEPLAEETSSASARFVQVSKQLEPYKSDVLSEAPSIRVGAWIDRSALE